MFFQEQPSSVAHFGGMVETVATNIRLLHMVYLSHLFSGMARGGRHLTSGGGMALSALAQLAHCVPYPKLNGGLLSNVILSLGTVIAGLSYSSCDTDTTTSAGPGRAGTGGTSCADAEGGSRLHWIIGILSQVLRKCGHSEEVGAALKRPLRFLRSDVKFPDSSGLFLRVNKTSTTSSMIMNVSPPASDDYVITSVGALVMHVTLGLVRWENRKRHKECMTDEQALKECLRMSLPAELMEAKTGRVDSSLGGVGGGKGGGGPTGPGGTGADTSSLWQHRTGGSIALDFLAMLKHMLALHYADEIRE